MLDGLYGPTMEGKKKCLRRSMLIVVNRVYGSTSNGTLAQLGQGGSNANIQAPTNMA